MTETHKLMAGVAAFIIIGFFMVGGNKEQSIEQMEAASMIRAYAALQSMGNRKCPPAIEREIGKKVYFPSDTKSDRDSYLTMTWEGEEGQGFKKAECTIRTSIGGISELVIDGKVVIKKGAS